LLFYHARLHCYVVIELKVTEFEPEHAGKLNFYIKAVDEQLRGDGDMPTIGILLCNGKDRVVVEYALSDMHKPMGVSEYELTQALPDELKSALPTIEQIEAELQQGDENEELNDHRRTDQVGGPSRGAPVYAIQDSRTLQIGTDHSECFAGYRGVLPSPFHQRQTGRTAFKTSRDLQALVRIQDVSVSPDHDLFVLQQAQSECSYRKLILFLHTNLEESRRSECAAQDGTSAPMVRG